MEWLNYHHLFYFYTVAREGSVAAAGRSLNLSLGTISSQIKRLESSLGEKLLERAGRQLVLTDRGKLVYSYAESIFSLGQELRNALRNTSSERSLRLTVGITDVVPKLIAHRLLEAVLTLPQEIHLVCREGKMEELIPSLLTHEVDIVLTDTPASPRVGVRTFNHLLGECPVAFFAAPELAERLRPDFPQSLHGQPFLIPTTNTTLRHALDHWFSSLALVPHIVGEFEDSALLRVFGQTGHGAFAAPQAIEEDLIRRCGVEAFGRTDAIREKFYAVALHRRLRHPAVVRVLEQARETLFGHRTPALPGAPRGPEAAGAPGASALPEL